MAGHQEIKSKDVLPSDEIAAVEKETPFERTLRLTIDTIVKFVAIVIALIGFAFLIDVMFAPGLEKYRDGAWSLLIALIGAAAGFIFGKRVS